jgi:hypothetical protein
MDYLQKLMVELERILKQYSPYLYERLRSPLDSSIIKDGFGKFGIYDEKIIELYQWKDGINNDGTVPTNAFEFCSFGVLLSLEYASTIYTSQILSNQWDKSIFPIIGNFSGDFLLYNSDPQSEQYGMISLYSPALFFMEDLPLYYDSIESMIKTTIECFITGAYKYDNKNLLLDVDLDLQYEISAKLNPKSSYWDDYR